MEPLISVIMPVYNSQDYIVQAVKSILRQTCPDFELILIVDCPTDDTLVVLKGLSDSRIVKLCNDKNMGIAFSRNRGLDVARGKYIALMDNDDISLPERFERQIRFLEDNPDIDIVGGAVEFIDGSGRRLEDCIKTYNNPRYIRANLLFRNVLINGTVMFRKKMLDDYGFRYRSNRLGMEDFDFWIDCFTCCRIANISEVVLQYRKHNNESTRVLTEKKKEKMELYARLQKRAISSEGFVLEDGEFECLTFLLNEYQENKVTFEDFISLCTILQKILLQACVLKKDYQEELMIVCRKILFFQLGRMQFA